jgi:peptide/nickel transport system permease protein
MGRYVIRRLLWTGLVVLVVTLLTFLIFFVMLPGNKAIRFAGKQPTPEIVAEVEKNLGLDKPVYVQYGIYLRHLAFGDGDECPKLLSPACRSQKVENFVLSDPPGCPAGVSGCGWPGLGVSYDSRTSVREEIVERMPRTLALAIGAAIVWVIMGVSIGVISALRRGSPADRVAMGFALFGVSAPVFWLGLMALFIFWKKLGFDALGTGYVEFATSPWGWFTHLLLPWFVLALLYAALYARMTRGNLIDVMGEDYIRTARAKGMPESRVVFKHGLRASLTPIVTMLGMDFALLIGGAIITETVFNIQGLGNYAVSAAKSQDFPAITGVVLVAAVFVAIMNLIVDVAYAYLDPRVRLS